MIKTKTLFLSKKQAFLSALLAIIITLSCVVSSFSSYNAYAADLSILDAPNCSVPTVGEKVDSKYEFIAKFIDGVTTISTFGDGWTSTINSNGETTTDRNFWSYSAQRVSNPELSKGNAGVRYSNVGTYNGQTIDLKITILDWDSRNPSLTGNISYAKEQIAHITSNMLWVDQKWEYVKSGTDTPVTVSGYMTLLDIDATQYVQFSSNTVEAIQKIYVPTADTWIKYANVGGAYRFYSPDLRNSATYDDIAQFTILYSDISNLTFRWGYDDIPVGSSPNYTDVITDLSDARGEYFLFMAKKPVATMPAAPTKTVSDTDETNVTDNTIEEKTESFTYSVYHNVPDEWEDFYYDSYVFTDSICDVLEIQSVKIYNSAGTEVTSKFDVTTSNNTVTASAKSSFLSSADFYYNNYRYDIQVQIKDGADLTAYIVSQTDKVIRYRFHNSAAISIDGDSSSSNRVTTDYEVVLPDEPVYPSIDKSIVDGNTLVESLTIPREDREITFSSTFSVANQIELESVVVSDTLEAPFAYKSLVVCDGDGNDVTSWGDIAVNGQTVTFTFKSDYFALDIGKVI